MSMSKSMLASCKDRATIALDSVKTLKETDFEQLCQFPDESSTALFTSGYLPPPTMGFTGSPAEPTGYRGVTSKSTGRMFRDLREA
jgi:hypothetical protein